MSRLDLLLKSRNIFRCDGSPVFSGAVLIRGTEIRAVLDEKQLAATPADCRRTIDCGDRLLIPGFCDSHVHAFIGAIQMQSADLTGCRSEHECVRRLGKFYSCRTLPEPGKGWLLGFGWNHYGWDPKKLPDRRSLDAAFGNIPVCLFNEEMHSAWVNSAGLREAGITRNSPQPGTGKIFLDESGEPCGYLLEPEAMQPVFEKALKLSPQQEKKLYTDLLNQAAETGITSLCDIDIFGTLNIDIYRKLEAENRLSCRIYPVFPIDTDIQRLEELRSELSSGFLKFGGVKEFLDGTSPMYTGVLVEPYQDRPGFNPEPLVDTAKTIKKAIELDRRGFRIRFHACGSGAVRLGLDIFEEVRKRNGFKDTRHTIEHIENIHPDDIPRFRKLGVTASVQPDHLWAETYEGHPFHKLLGESRCRWAWPFKSLIESGADVAFGTDFPVSPLNPMQGLYRAVSRLHEDGKPEGGWIPQEKLGIGESLIQYTAGSSKMMYAENLSGTLKAGTAADISVVDGNLFDMTAEELRRAKVYMTLSAGRITFGPV